MLESNFFRSSAGTVLVSIAAEAFRRQIVNFLSARGLQVLEARCGSEVLELTEHAYAIALFLADMPVEEAPGLLRAASRHRPDLRALVISGDPEYINRELVPDPCVHFIEKPFSWCEFSDKVTRLLRSDADPQAERAAA